VTREEFIEILDNEGYSYEIQGDKIDNSRLFNLMISKGMFM
jgi:hypothetical protein